MLPYVKVFPNSSLLYSKKVLTVSSYWWGIWNLPDLHKLLGFLDTCQWWPRAWASGIHYKGKQYLGGEIWMVKGKPRSFLNSPNSSSSSMISTLLLYSKKLPIPRSNLLFSPTDPFMPCTCQGTSCVDFWIFPHLLGISFYCNSITLFCTILNRNGMEKHEYIDLGIAINHTHMQQTPNSFIYKWWWIPFNRHGFKCTFFYIKYKWERKEKCNIKIKANEENWKVL